MRQEKIEEEIEQIKNPNELWMYINRERKRKIKITNKIQMHVCEWRDYFRGILEGKGGVWSCEAGITPV